LYETEKILTRDKLIYEHFFIGGCDWYIAEFDGRDTMFGYAILSDYHNAEWGYIPYGELKSVNVGGLEVDRDLYWNLQRADLIQKIVDSGGTRED